MLNVAISIFVAFFFLRLDISVIYNFVVVSVDCSHRTASFSLCIQDVRCEINLFREVDVTSMRQVMFLLYKSKEGIEFE